MGTQAGATQAGNLGGPTLFEQKVAIAHKAVLQTPGLQLRFSKFEPPHAPEWLKDLLPIIQAVAPLIRVLFWALLAVGVLLVVVFLIREVWVTRRRPRREAANPVDWRPDAAAARALLEEADSLAAEGRYEEAAHLLLFRSIEDLNQRRPGLVRPALTSRDIASLEVIPPEARRAFRRIAEAVERSFFGGRTLGEAEFAGCRRDYEAFAFTGAWS